MEPASLVERCQRGDAEAFRELFRAHQRDVARLAQRMLGRSTDLEDIVQEVFLQVHRSIRDFRHGARFSTWLYRVTVNVVLMHRRAAKSRPVFGELADHTPAVDPRGGSDEQLERQRRVQAFHRLLDRLSEKKRIVFLLHELEGLAPGEIAKIVGAPVLTVRTRLFYARRELLALLAEEPSLAGVAQELSLEAVPADDGSPAKEPA
ncbi:MAG TPA: sigma-70 family RNA polymerase sigma factor [Polyangiaceae bacterium]|nr:sigma-70 family RNA polymerase sigma factor [Polyangiaceae bacterium]